MPSAFSALVGDEPEASRRQSARPVPSDRAMSWSGVPFTGSESVRTGDALLCASFSAMLVFGSARTFALDVDITSADADLAGLTQFPPPPPPAAPAGTDYR